MRVVERKMKDIFIWLFIFILGSLIVNFMIEPQRFDSFKENVREISSDTLSKLKTTSENEAQDLILLEGDAIMYPCGLIGGDKRNICEMRCGIEADAEYVKYKCIKGGLNCYCK